MRKILAFIAAVVLVAVAIILVFTLRSSPPVPKSFQKQVNFAIFYPDGSQAKIQAGSFKYSDSTKSLSFLAKYLGQQITFAEQSSPDSFADDPSIYPKFIDKLNGYETFDSVNGRADITRPSGINSQAGVMNAKGTLLFARSNDSLSEDNWKLLFNSLVFIKPGK